MFLKKRFSSALLAILTLGWPVVCVVNAAGQDVSLDAAWAKAAKLQTPEARADFRAILDRADPETREASLGLALMLLSAQPKTEANIETAAGLFDQVAAGAGDDLSALARYYRARLEQVHRFEPDLSRAAALFSDLIEQQPAHPAAQFAVVKKAMIELYDTSSREVKGERLARLEQTAPQLTHLPARRDLHLLLAEGFTRLLQDDARALEHLLAADEIGISSSTARAHAWVRIGGLARSLGREDIAQKYDTRFLQAFPRDNRHYTVQQRLETPVNP